MPCRVPRQTTRRSWTIAEPPRSPPARDARARTRARSPPSRVSGAAASTSPCRCTIRRRGPRRVHPSASARRGAVHERQEPLRCAASTSRRDRSGGVMHGFSVRAPGPARNGTLVPFGDPVAQRAGAATQPLPLGPEHGLHPVGDADLCGRRSSDASSPVFSLIPSRTGDQLVRHALEQQRRAPPARGPRALQRIGRCLRLEQRACRPRIERRAALDRGANALDDILGRCVLEQ